MPRRVAPAALPLVVTAVVMTLCLGLGLTACDDDASPGGNPPTPTTTALDELATDDLTVVRGDFCSRVAPAEIEHALGSPVAETDSYANGDRAVLAPGVIDVAHEYGCSWTADDGTEARAWVFAPPVTPERARGLRDAAAQREGCSRLPDAPAFGAPSIAVRCGGTTTFQGLFGDAWLACSLRSTDLELAGRWCVDVIQAAG